MEHIEWCPSGYRHSGLLGQQIAIAGYSHWADEPDYEHFTIDCLQNVVSGKWRIHFFTSISGYFGFEDLSEFWNHVLFFNFLPTKIGNGLERFQYGGADQIAKGQLRVLRILGEHRPAKLFVFSKKAWQEFPPTIEDETTPPDFWHTYRTSNGHCIKAVGLRHPQGANGEIMTTRVRRLMSNPI